MMKNHRPIRVGLFGIGLDAYRQQFKGLKSRAWKVMSAPSVTRLNDRG